jgi:hypothetical protein
MSLFGSMAGAAANAMEGHAIGQAIGSANQRANHAEHQLDLWYNHAKKLEVMVDNLRDELKNSNTARSNLSAKLEAAEKELAEEIASTLRVMDNKANVLLENVVYGKKIKSRMIQLEKGLQHSSCDRASATHMLKIYQGLFGDLSTLLANGSISLETKEKAEAVWNEFRSTGKVTDSPEIQALLDEAPMPLKVHRIHI